MPNCIQFFSKTTRQSPTLNALDELIAAHLDMPVDDKRYCCEWYNNIAFPLALGKTFDQIRETYREPDQWYKPEYIAKLQSIIDFLEENYTTDAWTEIGKR